jgi:hypothetical protein
MLPSPSRVAVLYLEGGVFDAPPAMMKAILPWMLGVYAGHVLANVEEAIAKVQDVTAPIKAEIKMYHDILDRLPQDIAKLKEKDHVRYVVPGGGMVIGVRRSEAYLSPDGAHTYFAGFAAGHEPGPEYQPLYQVGTGKKSVRFNAFRQYPRGQAQDWARNTVAEYLGRAERRLERYKGTVVESGNTIVDLQLLRRECRKHTSKAKTYASKAERKFPVYLTGWKYVQPGGPQRDLKPWAWDTITVILDFKGHTERGGVWMAHTRELQVDAKYAGALTTSLFQMGVEWIKEALRHELQHLGQDLKDFLDGLPRDTTGLPSRRIRSPGVNPAGHPTSGGERLPHALRDVEFYTRLADEVDGFLLTIRNWPKNKWRDRVRAWVGDPVDPLLTSHFFKALRENQPAKWRKAVAEFIKAIGERGAEIPSTS